MRSKAPLLVALFSLLLTTALGAQESLGDLILRADVNRDLVVNAADVAVVRGALGKRCGQVGYIAAADVNVAGGNCVIDLNDVNFVQRFVGSRVPDPPTITGRITPAPNAAGWNNANVTINFTCVNAAVCPSPISVATEGANQSFTGTAQGLVTGVTASTTVVVNLDKTAPAVQITSPGTGSTVTTATVAVQGTYPASGSPITSLTCNGAAASFAAGSFDCTVPLALGANTMTAVAADAAGNTGQASINVTRGSPAVPTITGTISPAPNAAGWNNTNVTITFTCTNATTCQAPISVSSEGANQTFTGTATGPGGSVSTNVSVSLDKTAPVVTFTSPAENSATAANSVNVAGSVSAGGSPIASATSASGVPIQIAQLNLSSVEPLPVVGTNTIQWTVTDVAGNVGGGTLHVRYTPPTPTITATPTPTANAAGWNNTNVVVSFQCTNATSCPSPVTVSTEGLNQTITGTASSPGGSVDASVTLNIDKTAPLVQIISPLNNTSVASPVQVQGTFSTGGSPIASVVCGGAATLPVGNGFSCSPSFPNGPQTIGVVVTDAAGNVGNASVQVTIGIFSTAGPGVAFSTPAPLAVFNGTQTPVTVTGTIDTPGSAIVVTSSDSPNGVQAGVSGNTWTASNVALKEGNNLLTVKATGPGGGVSTATLTVVLDTTPPIVRIDSPVAGALLTTGQISVAGVVNDIVSGTVNSEQVSVQVNGLDAQIANRSFIVPELLLARGQTTLTAVAIDRAGNEARFQVQVTLQDNLRQQRIEVVSGDHQTALIGSLLPDPLTVRLLDANDAPVRGRPVTFDVVKSEGTLRSGDEQVQTLTVLTDEQGNASTVFTLGSRSGVGNNQIRVSAAGFAGRPVFSESATHGPAAQINVVSGNDQRGTVGQDLALPFVIIVFDSGGNPVAGEPIDFKMLQGGGQVSELPEVLVNTNSDGKATALLRLGQNGRRQQQHHRGRVRRRSGEHTRDPARHLPRDGLCAWRRSRHQGQRGGPG